MSDKTPPLTVSTAAWCATCDYYHGPAVSACSRCGGQLVLVRIETHPGESPDPAPQPADEPAPVPPPVDALLDLVDELHSAVRDDDSTGIDRARGNIVMAIRDLYAAGVEEGHGLLDRAVIQEIEQRERAEEIADKLTAAIGRHLGDDFGEHSNLNDPWGRALVALAEADAGGKFAGGAYERGIFDEGIREGRRQRDAEIHANVFTSARLAAAEAGFGPAPESVTVSYETRATAYEQGIYDAGVAEGRRQATEERTEEQQSAAVTVKGCLGVNSGHGKSDVHYWRCSSPECAGHLCRKDGLAEGAIVDGRRTIEPDETVTHD